MKIHLEGFQGSIKKEQSKGQIVEVGWRINMVWFALIPSTTQPIMDSVEVYPCTHGVRVCMVQQSIFSFNDCLYIISQVIVSSAVSASDAPDIDSYPPSRCAPNVISSFPVVPCSCQLIEIRWRWLVERVFQRPDSICSFFSCQPLMARIDDDLLLIFRYCTLETQRDKSEDDDKQRQQDDRKKQTSKCGI